MRAQADALITQWDRIGARTADAHTLQELNAAVANTATPAERALWAAALAGFWLDQVQTPDRAAEVVKSLVIPAAAVKSEPAGSPWGALGLAQPSTWSDAKEALPAAMELIRVLARRGHFDLALTVIERYRPAFSADREAQAFAAQATADGMAFTQRLDQAVELYELAQAILADLAHPAASTYPQRSVAGEVARWRIDRALTDVRHRRDLERYGPAFVLYRDAEWQRRRASDVAGALMSYRKLSRDFPNTIYDEAAQAYAIISLFTCVGRDQSERSAQTLQRITGRTAALIKTLNDLGAMGASVDAVTAQRAAIAEQQALLDDARRLPPSGAKAAALAEQTAADFLARDPNGVYRGEVLLALGDDAWDRQADPAMAMRWYTKARTWFAGIVAHDAAIDAFQFDPRVAKVAAPPADRRQTDDWGNATWAAVEPGMLVNHRTCGWYVSYHLGVCAGKISLCAFAVGDAAAAQDALAALLDQDAVVKAQHAAGMPNTFDRLSAGIAQGRMFATAEELAAFTGVDHLALIAAEYHFQTEDYAGARVRYDSLMQTAGERLKPAARTYLRYMQGCGALMTRDEAVARAAFEDVVTTAPKTATWPRAALELYKMLQWSPDNRDQALMWLDHIAEKFPQQEWGLRAIYYKAEFLMAHDRASEARDLFGKVLARAPKTWLARGATQRLAQLDHQSPSVEKP